MGQSKSNEKVPMHVQIVIALILGVGCGVFLGEDFVWIGVLGQIFVSFLKMVVVPLIFCSIVVAIASIGDGRLGQLGSKTIAYYLLTTGLVLAASAFATLASSRAAAAAAASIAARRLKCSLSSLSRRASR